MGPKILSKRGRRGNVLIMMCLLWPCLIVPLVGLGIDATICYIVQGELSAAVDGAALGAGRLLGTAATPSVIAGEYLNANFRLGTAGFWGAYNLTPTITSTTGITNTITVTANANVPLLFMRIIGFSTATVGATATATRRDARIEVVIDRSGSMNTSDGEGSTVIADLVTYAQAFVNEFTEGADEMGLVVFDGSGVVGYPNTTWPASLSATATTGGPDTSFKSGATGANPDMVHQIAAVTAGGGTGMGDGLALAYIELQKAHERDLAADGADLRSNAVVLFTDGVPSAMSAYLNKSGSSVISGSSGCTHTSDSGTNPMYGWVVLYGSPSYDTNGGTAFFQLASIDTTSGHTSNWYMSHPGTSSGSGDFVSPTPTAPESGCGSFSTLGNNLSAIPSTDKYGYSVLALGSGYKVSSILNGSVSSVYEGTSLNLTNATNSYQWGLVDWDEADQVANAIRSDTNYTARGDTGPMSVTIFTIGYTGNGGTDQGLLSKIANTNPCTFNTYTCYNSAQNTGLFIPASNKTELADAFATIATAVLRLSH